MAKRKSKANQGAIAGPPMSDRMSVGIDIEKAENGHVVRINHEGKDGYKVKRYIASSLPQARLIAAQGLSGFLGGKKSGSKKSRRGKAFVSKKG